MADIKYRSFRVTEPLTSRYADVFKAQNLRVHVPAINWGRMLRGRLEISTIYDSSPRSGVAATRKRPVVQSTVSTEGVWVVVSRTPEWGRRIA